MLSILVFEDNDSMGELAKMILEMGGHKVTWMMGASACDADTITAIAPDRSSQIINPGEYDVAFLDGKLIGGLDGWDIAPTLVSAGVVCIGMSAGGEHNPKIVERGARLAIRKEDFLKQHAAMIEQAVAIRA